MLLGTEIGAALTALEPYDIDVIGLNCATGPAEMNEAVRYLAPQFDQRQFPSFPTPACRRTKAATPSTNSRPKSWQNTTNISSVDYGSPHRRRMLRHHAPSTSKPWSTPSPASNPRRGK